MALAAAVQAGAAAEPAAPVSAWAPAWPASGQVPAALVAVLLLLVAARGLWRVLSTHVPAWHLAGLRLGLAAGALALPPVADLGAFASPGVRPGRRAGLTVLGWRPVTNLRERSVPRALR